MSTYNTCTCISIQLALINIGLYAGTCIHADKTKTNLILIKTNDCVQKYIHFSMNRDMVKVIDIT